MKLSVEKWALLGILALAAFLRMAWPGLMDFKLDEAHLYALALDLAQFKAFPLHGIGSSIGLPNTPISVYLFALPLFIWQSPLAATLWVGALNTAAVGLTYWFTRRYWGSAVALVASLLYAVAPWAVLYSRTIWAQDLLPFFVICYIITAALTFVEGRPRWLIAHGLCLALVAQIHFSGLIFGVLTLGWLWDFRQRVPGRMVVYGALAMLALALPFIVYFISSGSLAANSSSGLNIIQRLFAQSPQVSLDAARYALLLASGAEAHSLAGPAMFRQFLASVPDFSALTLLQIILVIVGLGYALSQTFTTRWQLAWPSPFAPQAFRLLWAWALVPVLLFTVHLTPVYPHYFILLFPVPFILAGIALAPALARGRWAWLVTLGLAASQVWFSLALGQFVYTHATPGGMGVPLDKLLAVTTQARALGGEVLVVSAGADPAYEQEPAVLDVLLREVPHRFVDGRDLAVLPAVTSTVLVWPTTYHWRGPELYQAWGGGQWAAAVPLRTGEGSVLLANGPAHWPTTPRPRPASALLANGAEVLGVGGELAHWEVWWRAPGPHEEDYHIFAHLLNTAGERTAQTDVATYVASAWRAEDLVVSHLPLGGSGNMVRVGFYAYPALIPVAVLDANGEPAGEWLEFPAK